MARCLRVPKELGESVRSALMDAGLLDPDHRIGREGDHILIPVLCDRFDGYEAENAVLAENERKITDYRELLPEGMRDSLPTSFDVVGDIVIVKLKEDVVKHKRRIGDAIGRTADARMVLLDSGVKGDMRVRDLTPIYGKGSTETLHRESGVSMAVDPSTVYFNPRLATERLRIASLVEDGEIVIDMFAGVAPFPLVICRHARPKAVYAIDMNPEAKRLMDINIGKSGCDRIFPILGDARAEIAKLPPADRVIMNLPQSAEDFLPDALSHAKKGGTVHLYSIHERSEAEREIGELIERMVSDGLLCEISGIREMKSYSPTSAVYATDILRR